MTKTIDEDFDLRPGGHGDGSYSRGCSYESKGFRRSRVTEE